MEIRYGGTMILKALRSRPPFIPLYCRNYSKSINHPSSTFTIEGGDGDIKQSEAERIAYLEERLRILEAENSSSELWPPQSNRGNHHALATGDQRKWNTRKNQRLEPTKARLSGHALYRVISSSKDGKEYYRIGIGSSYLTMPSKIANNLWHFHQLPKEERLIKLTMDVSDGPHENAWATKALEIDTASRLGIRIQHQDLPPIWLKSDSGTSVVFANSWTDWMEGKITDLEKHQWGIDRYPFLGPLCEVFAPSSGGEVYHDVRKRLLALLKGEVLKPQWKFTRGHEARLARYEALNGKMSLPKNVGDNGIFDVGYAQLRLLGSRRKCWRDLPEKVAEEVPGKVPEE